MSTPTPLPVYVPDYTTLEVAGDRLCSWCFQPGDPIRRPLKRCSACQRVSYCSAPCQKLDWKHRHKLFCPQYKKVNKYDREVLGDKQLSLAELDRHNEARKAVLQSNDPSQHEPCQACCSSIIKHSIVCEVCHKSPYQADTFKSFESCSKCELARYCSQACKDSLGSVHTSEDCATLRLLGATERTMIDYHLNRKKIAALEVMMVPTERPRRVYKPLSRYTGFDQFHRELSREHGNSADITIMYRALANSFPTSHPMAVQAIGQMATEVESIPLTIVAGLEASIPDLAKRDSIEIHVVAASSRELSSSAMTEEILHQIPTIKRLQIHYIGPEASKQSDPLVDYACATCKRRGSSRKWSTHAVEYHRFLAEHPGKRPDLIVGLNTGWSEIEAASWSRTLDRICALKTPTLFTAYSLNEARREHMLLQLRHVRFIANVEENKWKGVIPNVNKGIKLTQGTLGVYQSSYWYIFQGN